MSGAEPCTGSKIAACVPMLAPGASPKPPINPAASSERMSPNRFVVTMTSNCSGLITSCIAVLSTILSSDAIVPAYCSATRRATSRNSPDVAFRMLALWTIVTFLRPCVLAYSNAYLAMRSLPSRVTIDIACAIARRSVPILNV